MATLWYLIRYHGSSCVVALFQSAPVHDKIFRGLLKLFGMRYEFQRMEFVSLKKNPYMQIFRNSESIVHKLVSASLLDLPDSAVKSSLLKVAERQLFMCLWRVVSIMNFVNTNIQDVEHIYISNPLGKKKNDTLMGLINDAYSAYDMTLYSSYSKVDDTGYLYPQSMYINRLYFMFIYVKIIKLVLFPAVVFRKHNKFSDAIYFLHNENEQKYINARGVLKNNGDHLVIYHNYTYYDGNERGNLGVLYSNYFKYLWRMLSGVLYFRKFKDFNPMIFYGLLGCWRDLYFLKRIYERCNIKYVYSNYESNISYMGLASAKDDHQIASFAAVWSGGSFPSDMVATYHKYSDRFFVWGDWHRVLFEASNDRSDKYVEVGYIGDHEISAMIDAAKTVEVVQKNNYNKIISIYDTTMFHDLFFCEKTLASILDVLLELAVKLNYLIILKTKHKNNLLIKDKLKKYINHLVINDEKGDLSPALMSDLIIGVSLSTPVMLAASYGKNILLYDNADTAWSRFEEMFGRDLIVNNEIDLKNSVIERLMSEQCVPDNISQYNTRIGTTTAQDKMSDYIDWFIASSSKNKYASLQYADNKYMKKYMNHKVIKNKKYHASSEGDRSVCTETRRY